MGVVGVLMMMRRRKKMEMTLEKKRLVLRLVEVLRKQVG